MEEGRWNCIPEHMVDIKCYCPTLLQGVLCNAVLCELIQRRVISKDMFRLNHPGGSIGSLLKREQGLD